MTQPMLVVMGKRWVTVAASSSLSCTFFCVTITAVLSLRTPMLVSPLVVIALKAYSATYQIDERRSMNMKGLKNQAFKIIILTRNK